MVYAGLPGPDKTSNDVQKELTHANVNADDQRGCVLPSDADSGHEVLKFGRALGVKEA